MDNCANRYIAKWESVASTYLATLAGLEDISYFHPTRRQDISFLTIVVVK
jgi:hypothetical protein